MSARRLALLATLLACTGCGEPTEASREGGDSTKETGREIHPPAAETARSERDDSEVGPVREAKLPRDVISAIIANSSHDPDNISRSIRRGDGVLEVVFDDPSKGPAEVFEFRGKGSTWLLISRRALDE